MATLTVTSRGQVTLRKEFLEHIGVKPGDQIDLRKTPNGKGSWEDFFGCLKNKSNVRLTIEEINDAIAEAGAEAGMAGLKR
jgi:bifunctional DNA-binding transcriptional regulator/antitoxin component of YhaV-PrlF toxin-antitoxin module